MHVNIYQFFTKKKKHSLFTPFISKNEYDKSNIKNINDPLKCERLNTQKVYVVLQFVNDK